jgi:hypothetical protein
VKGTFGNRRKRLVLFPIMDGCARFSALSLRVRRSCACQGRRPYYLNAPRGPDSVWSAPLDLPSADAKPTFLYSGQLRMRPVLTFDSPDVCGRGPYRDRSICETSPTDRTPALG